MIDKIEKKLCTGCNTCYSICPQNCIDMVSDELGFLYPKVNYEKCIKCKKCVEVCPSLGVTSRENKWENPEIYAAWSLNEEIRETSTSGGIFSEFANEIIRSGGLVAGAKYAENHLVEHHIVDSLIGVEELKQSKYVQSNINDVYKKILTELKKDKLVAFCGSPCQVAGLLKYLGKTYEKLITFDFVCRGTNSPKAYLKYLDMLSTKYNSKIKRVWFKNKIYGWNRFSTRVDFVNGKTYIKDRYHDLYMRGYIEENLYMRPCCFECKYKDFPRVSDITFADFWGVGKKKTSLDTDKGTSLLMVNSQKGSDLVEQISDYIYREKMDLGAAILENESIIKSAKKNSDSKEFLKMLDLDSFDVCFKKYAKNTGRRRFNLIIRRKLSYIKTFFASLFEGA